MQRIIGERNIEGIPALTLITKERGGVEATFVPSADFVCHLLRHRGHELLGQRGGLRSYIEERSTMGIPLLHPWANRLARGRFSAAGTSLLGLVGGTGSPINPMAIL